MGVVYRALDVRLNRLVAIKVLGEEFRSNQAAWGFLRREARIISALAHPSICTLYDVDKEKEQPYIAMEYVEGCPLRQFLMPTGLNPHLVAHAARHIAPALAHAHERGIIHRHITSSSIMVTHQGDLKVLDFGLAQRLRSGTASGSSLPPSSSMDLGRLPGTLHYLAPEVLCGERAYVWTDIWSFGVLLHEMATGDLPYRGKTVFELTTAILTSEPEPPARKIPPWTAYVIARCLERDVTRRYRCMRDIITDLPREGIADCVDMAMELDRYYARPAPVVLQMRAAA